MFEDLGLEPDIDDINETSYFDMAEEEGLLPPRSARKCFGHVEIERQLLSLYNSGSLPHAMIFSGPTGIGKATFAYRFIRFLLSQKDGDEIASLFGEELEPGQPDSFDVGFDSPAFSKVASGGHPDLRTLERREDDASGKIKTSLDLGEIRKLPEFLRLTPAEGGWRMAIVDEAETMNKFGQNALLKILEEPPAKSILILITRSVGALIPTIRSRSRVFHFAPLSDEIMSNLLYKLDPKIPETDRKLLTALSCGQIGLAQKYYESGGLASFTKLLESLATWPDIRWDQIYALADQLAQKGQDAQYECFRDGFVWILQEMVESKARGNTIPVADLDTPGLDRLYRENDLHSLIRLYDTLKAHFAEADKSFLNRQQVILGTYFKLTGHS